MNNIILKTVIAPEKKILNTLRKKLKKYNESIVGSYDTRNVAAYFLNEKQQIIAGMFGWFMFGWLYIDIAWVHEKYRKKGLGSRLLKSLENLAIENHIYRSRLTTGSFQALDFYKKHGYEIFATLPIYASNSPNEKEHFEYFLKKELKNVYLSQATA